MCHLFPYGVTWPLDERMNEVQWAKVIVYECPEGGTVAQDSFHKVLFLHEGFMTIDHWNYLMQSESKGSI